MFRVVAIRGKLMFEDAPLSGCVAEGAVPSPPAASGEALAAANLRISCKIKARGKEATKKPGSKLLSASSNSGSCTPDTML
mmetsp:Transcript_391/g.576  ORF Transcript_391/g.576 Transcript_391/m.576 type:complete len:81 (+) Transcript_391:1084-1326(+)